MANLYLSFHTTRPFLPTQERGGPYVKLILEEMGFDPVSVFRRTGWEVEGQFCRLETDEDCMVNLDKMLRIIAYNQMVTLDYQLGGTEFYIDSIRRLQQSVGVESNLLEGWLDVNDHGMMFGPDLIGALCCLDKEANTDYVSYVLKGPLASSDVVIRLVSPTVYHTERPDNVLEAMADIHQAILKHDPVAAAKEMHIVCLQHLIWQSDETKASVFRELATLLIGEADRLSNPPIEVKEDVIS